MEDLSHVRKYEVLHPIFKIKGEGKNGCFYIPYESYTLIVIASDGMGWDHVSISLNHGKKLPNWKMLTYIKELFFEDDETVVQFIPKKSEYVNNAEVLHLWHNQSYDYDLPPSITVGIK